jgi:hypothetical protein
MGSLLTPVTPGFYSGIDGRVFLASWTAGSPPTETAMELSITKWSGDYSCPMSDRTNSKSGGQQAGTRTIKSFNGQFSCVVPNDATGDPEFEPGNTYPCWLIAHDGRGYQMFAYIETISPSSETSGDLGFDVKFKSNYLADQTALGGPGITPWTNTDLSYLPAGVTGQGSSSTGTV